MNRYHYFDNQPPDEAKWIEEAKRDIDKFSLLYDHYFIPVFRFILKRVISQDVAADLCSQVFLKAMLNIKKYEDRGFPFACWLIRIAKNEVNLSFRNKKIMRNIDINSQKIPEIMEDLQEDAMEEEIGILKKAMEKLDTEEISMIEMFYFDNIRLKELAGIFNLTETNVKVKLFRIRKKLRKIMEKFNNNEQISLYYR